MVRNREHTDHNRDRTARNRLMARGNRNSRLSRKFRRSASKIDRRPTTVSNQFSLCPATTTAPRTSWKKSSKGIIKEALPISRRPSCSIRRTELQCVIGARFARPCTSGRSHIGMHQLPSRCPQSKRGATQPVGSARRIKRKSMRTRCELVALANRPCRTREVPDFSVLPAQSTVPRPAPLRSYCPRAAVRHGRCRGCRRRPNRCPWLAAGRQSARQDAPPRR